MEKILSAKLLLQLLLLLGLLLLAGCVAPQQWVWQHPQGLGQPELQQAINDCQQIAQGEVNRNDYFTPYLLPRYGLYDDPFFYRRHRYLYYYPPAYYYDSERRYFDEQRFFRICMHAKGWRQVPVTPAH